jgi:hypothetical protein
MVRESAQPFCVSYPVPLVAGALLWADGWSVLADVTVRKGWHPRHGNLDAVGVVFMALMWLVGGLLGPVVIFRYGTTLRVTDKQIRVGEWFGLRRREYDRAAVVGAVVFQRGRRVVLRIAFADGQRLEIDHWAKNFGRLKAYFETSLT